MAESASNTIQEKCTFVKLRYKVRVPNGRYIKGAVEPEEMDFITGYGQVIPGLEKRLLGRALGEKMNFIVPFDEAFGPRYDQLVIEKNKDDFHFPPGFAPYVGMEMPIILSREEGPDTVTIKEIKENTIIVDGNHALAGVPLEYDLEIIEARPAKESEVCSEWETPSDSQCAGGSCPALHEVVLGKQED